MHCECMDVKVVYTQFIFIGVLGLSVSSINRKLDTAFYNYFFMPRLFQGGIYREASIKTS